MQYPDDQIGGVVELRERVAGEVEELEERLDYLKRHLQVLDTILKGSSFTKASSLGYADARAGMRRAGSADAQTAAAPRDAASGNEASDRSSITENGRKVAEIEVAAGQITITIPDGIGLRPDIPPLKTFFLDRILGEMQKRDGEEGAEPLEYELDQDGGVLRGITIRNYRTQGRADEIKSTARWTLLRMLEKIE